MKKRWVACFLMGSLLFFCDFFSKKWVLQHIQSSPAVPFYPYGGIAVFRDCLGVDFAIVHVGNKGIAWGMLSSLEHYLPYLRIGLIFLLAFFIFSFRRTKLIGPLVLLLVGAVGNVVDYFLYGHVLDMFFFRLWGYSYPVFNIADSLIFLGVVSFFYVSHRIKKYESIPH